MRWLRAKPLEKFEDVKWGKPAPTKKQFAYAKSLGVNVTHGMTTYTISEDIERAENDGKSATKKQLREIAKMHGVLAREITAAEADDVIEFLDGHSFRCPHCHEDCCCADDTTCPLCRKSLREVKIPIKLPKRKR